MEEGPTETMKSISEDSVVIRKSVLGVKQKDSGVEGKDRKMKAGCFQSGQRMKVDRAVAKSTCKVVSLCEGRIAPQVCSLSN